MIINPLTMYWSDQRVVASLHFYFCWLVNKQFEPICLNAYYITNWFLIIFGRRQLWWWWWWWWSALLRWRPFASHCHCYTTGANNQTRTIYRIDYKLYSFELEMFHSTSHVGSNWSWFTISLLFFSHTKNIILVYCSFYIYTNDNL